MSEFSNYDVSKLKNELENESLPALREAGLIQDESKINYLENYRENYSTNQAQHYEKDKLAEKYYNSKQYVNIVRKEVSKVLSWAVRTGNKSIINHALGLAEGDGETSLKGAYADILDELNRDASVIMIRGAPGTGKTSKAVSITDLAIELGVVDKAITNISLADLAEMNKWEFSQRLSEIIDWTQQAGDKIVTLDEISRILNQKAGNQSEGYEAADILGNLFPALRKQSEGNVKIIVIAHRDDKDALKVIRQYTNMVIYSYDRDDKTKAHIYKDEPLGDVKYAYDRFQANHIDPDLYTNQFKRIRNPALKIDGSNSARLIIDADNINRAEYPQIFNSIDTQDAGDGSGEKEGANEEMIKEAKKELAAQKYKETDASYRELAEKYEVSKDTIRREVQN